MPGQPLPHLLQALTGQPALGWVLKSLPSLTYLRWSGTLPMNDPQVARRSHGLSGSADSDHFDPVQSSLLRAADLRAVRQVVPLAEIHRLESLHAAVEWRAWRLLLRPGADRPGYLLVVWMDLGHDARAQHQLALARQQIQAQQLLIAQLHAPEQQAAQERNEMHEPPGPPGGPGPQPQDWPPGPAWRQAVASADALDTLAGAATRFSEQLRRELDLSRRERRSFALLLLALGESDADHTMADAAACGLLARQLSTGARAMDTVAQIGPRRFGVLLSGAPLTPAYTRAEALRRQAVQHVVMDQGVAQPLRLYVGLAVYPLTADQVDALMASAESALAEARAQKPDEGHGCTVMARVALRAPPTS